MKILLLGLAAAVAMGAAQTSSAAPLSCEMQQLLTYTAALGRDKGWPPSKTREALKKGDELTNAEVKSVIDIVYVHMKNSTPKEIAQAVALVCKD